MADIKEFTRQVNDFATKLVPAQAVNLQKAIAIEALKKIVERTPVDTGRARGNWQVTIDAPTEQMIGPSPKADHAEARAAFSGSDPVAAGQKVIHGVRGYHTIHITNNVPYIIYLEEGTPRMKPFGMVKRTIQDLAVLFQVPGAAQREAVPAGPAS